MTGSLMLSQMKGMRSVTRRLLSLPGSTHFWKLKFEWGGGEDLLLVIPLEKECSHTPESLEIDSGFCPFGICARTNNLISF